MINKEKIQQAANEYVGCSPEIGEDLIEYLMRNAFKSGIEWLRKFFGMTKMIFHSQDSVF